MLKFNVTVYYNTNNMAMVNGFKNGDILEQVWTGVMLGDELKPLQICMNMYSKLNDFIAPTHNLRRSFSVGDVVEVGQQLFACASNGWEWINKPYTNPHMDLRPVMAKPNKDMKISDFRVEIQAEIHKSVGLGNKINTIKYLRAKADDLGYSFGLKAAKELADQLFFDHAKTLVVHCWNDDYSLGLCDATVGMHHNVVGQHQMEKVTCEACIAIRNAQIQSGK